jgi:hypothetical protein
MFSCFLRHKWGFKNTHFWFVCNTAFAMSPKSKSNGNRMWILFISELSSLSEYDESDESDSDEAAELVAALSCESFESPDFLESFSRSCRSSVVASRPWMSPSARGMSWNKTKITKY